MAVITAERTRESISVTFNLSAIKGLFRAKEARVKKVKPWENIWETSIPPEVVFTTTGQCLKHQTAILFPIRNEQNDGVRFWREQTREELVKHMNRTPRSKEVYRRLREAGMIIPLDLTGVNMRETLMERWQQLRDNIDVGKNRLVAAIRS